MYQAIPSESYSDKNDKSETVKFSHFNEETDGPALPGTIYTSAMICSLGFSAEELFSLSGIFVMIPQWFNIAFNFFFSVVVIVCIRELRDVTPECESDFLLLMISVIAFTTYNIGEIFETFWMIHWIYNQPTCESHEQLTFSGGDDKEIVSGMTAGYKLWCYLAIVLPKLLIGGLITFYGNTFLLVSDSNQDVILNSMALGFITQNDEVMFQALVPQHMKDVSENLPPMKVSQSTKMYLLFKPYFAAACIAIIVFATYADVCFDDPVK